MPEVSVITLCPDQYVGFLAECAASLAAQTYRDFEWVIIHINPDDWGLACSIMELAQAVEVDVKIDTAKPDPGICTCRNTGLHHAKGKYITMLDADDMLHPTFLEKVVTRAGPKKLICPGIEEIGRDGRGWPTWGFTVKDFLHQNRIFACSMYPRKLVEEIGGYDEELNWLGCEDYELWIRAVKAGYTVEVVPEILFRYRVHEGSHTARYSKFDHERYGYIRRKHPLEG